MIETLKIIRPIPEKSIKRNTLYALFVVLLGFALGYMAKATDSISVAGEIGSDLGIWIFVAALICAFSRTPLMAAVNAPLFFLSVLCAYYLYGQIVLGFFPKDYFMGWLVISLLSPIGGFLSWLSRGNGWKANMCAALPVSILFAWGCPFYYTFQIPLMLDMLYAFILLIVLPRAWREKAIALGIACVLAFIIVQSDLLSYLPF
ncbi:MAG: DUF6518 family protein [Clostridiales bacterium]|nr:DUF6518 family protein [Clostridiales bacterium]